MNGLLIPVTTPFDPVTGDVAPIPFRANVRRWTEAPIDGLVLSGSTGEGRLLELDEKLELVAYARDLVPAGMPLVVGVSEESTRQAVRSTHRLAEAGAHAVLVSAPAFLGPTLKTTGLREHFETIADASSVPVIIDPTPRFTRVALEPGLVRELSRHPNIVGLKDSSGDLRRLAEYTEACEGRCGVLVGNGALLYTALELGGTGGIIALGLIATRECAEIVTRFRAGETQAAGALQTRIAPVHRQIIQRYGAPGVKAALDRIGLAGGPTRRPLLDLTERERKKVARVLHHAQLI